MNKIHKSQYNESLGTWVAVPEIAKGRGKATSVAKEIPMTPSLPKFAVSALTLALLQVVSVSAYGADLYGEGNGKNEIGFNAYVCDWGNNSFSCGTKTTAIEIESTSSTAIGSSIYAGMSTAVGHDILIGNTNDPKKYQEIIKKAKKDAIDAGENEKNYKRYLSNHINPRDFETGKNSVAVGSNISVNTSDTVAIGHNIKNTKENSIFLGNNSGYIANDGSKSLGSDEGTKEQLRLLDGVGYAGASNIGGVVSIASGDQTRRIQGVAPGLVSENSADAINGAQLYAAYSTIDGNTDKIEDNAAKIDGNTTKIDGNTAKIDGNTTKIEENTAKIAQGWDIATLDATAITEEFEKTDKANIKLGDTVNFADSDTVSVALKKDGNNKVAVQFNVDQNKIQNNALKQLPVVYTDKDGNIVQRVGEKWYQTSEIEKVNGDYSKLSGGIDGNQILAASLHNPVADGGKRGKPFKLTNLDDGNIAKDSRDAINGSQLYGIKEKIEYEIDQGWNIGKVDASTLDGLDDINTDKKIALGDSVKFAGSDTVSVALKNVGDNTVAVQINLNQDKVHGETLAQLPVVYTDGDGNIVQRGKDGKWYKRSEIADANGEYTGLTGIGDNDIIAAIHNPVGTASKNISGNPFKLTNLADGNIAKDSRDAVNGSQLYATNTKVEHNTSKINQGWNIGKVDASALDGLDDINTDKKIALGDSVKFADSEMVSVALKDTGDNTVAVQIDLNQDKVHGETLAQLPVVYTDGDGNIVQRGKDGKWYKRSAIADANGDYSGLTVIEDNNIIAAMHHPADKDISGNAFKLTNLAKGLVSAESKDAINGGQLFSDRVALAGLLGGGAAALTPDKKEGFTLNADGKKVPVKVLDGLMLDGDFQAPTFTVNKANGDIYQIGSGADVKDAVAHNVGEALQNLNKYVNEGITVADNKGGSGSLAPTETLKFANGKKTTANVTKDENTGVVTVTVDVDSDVIANDVLSQGPIIYTVKNEGKNAPVVKIENKWYLAKDVANDQPIADAQVQDPSSIQASLRNPGNANATSAGDAYVLNNIADGVDDFDAINKRQFNYAVVYGDSSNPNYAQTVDHSFVAFKGMPAVEVLENGKTKDGTGTQLRNVASAGDINLASNAGHAVNAGDLKYQVDSLTNSLTEKGLYFAGDSDDSVHKNLGETLKVTGDDNIKVAASNGGLQISIKNNPTFAGKVTAEGGIVAGASNPIKINTDGDGKIHGLTNVSIDDLDNGASGTSVAATEAQLDKVIAKIDGNDKRINVRINEGRVFSGDIGEPVKVGLGEALAVNGGISDESKLSDGNIGVVTKESGLEIKLGKNLNDINSISLTASEPNRDNGDNGTPSTTTDLSNNGIRIKPGAVGGAEVTLTDTGLDNGGNKITNVGDGLIAENSKEAVNGGQLLDQIEAVKNIIGGPVEYNPDATNPADRYVVNNTDRDGNGNPSGGIGGTGQKTIDAAINWIKNQKETPYSAGKNIKISQDGTGTRVIETKDDVQFQSVTIAGANQNKSVKINGTGIDAGDMKIRNVAPGQVSPLSKDAVNGSQLYQVKQDINEMDQRARSGIASAMASAGLPQAYLPGKSMVGAAASNYRGETAIAVGLSSISDNGKWLVKADANANRRDFGVSLGVGYQW